MPGFRRAPGRQPAWIDAGGSFSNFEFIDTRFGSHPILRRLFSLARKADFQGLLIDRLIESDSPLLAAENAALALRRPDFKGADVTRFSFFTGREQSAPGRFLGYAVLKQDKYADSAVSHVYEAVIVASRSRQHNNFVHCARRHAVSTSMGDFEVTGVLYAQQNNATTVCAHVAIRTLLSCLLPQGDAPYPEINRHAGVDHAHPNTQVGDGRGLRVHQVEAVLKAYGLNPRVDVHEPGQLELPPGLEFQRLLYDFIESGRPALLGFELAPDPATGNSSRHVIPVFGHTFNEDLWVPEAERDYFAHNRGYFPSESWLSSYLAHDDNFGPYVCLPRHYLGRNQLRLVVGCHAPEVSVTGAEAETLAVDVAHNFARGIPPTRSAWFERFRAFAQAHLLVVRAQIVSPEAYREHLTGLRDREGFDLEPEHRNALVSGFPALVWLMELSAPELFPATRAKFGEVVIDAAQPPTNSGSLLSVRLPGCVAFGTAAELNVSTTRLTGHTPLFTRSAA